MNFSIKQATITRAAFYQNRATQQRQVNDAVRPAGEMGIHGPRHARAIRVAIIIEHHHPAGRETGIHKGTAIAHGALDIDIDMSESRTRGSGRPSWR